MVRRKPPRRLPGAAHPGRRSRASIGADVGAIIIRFIIFVIGAKVTVAGAGIGGDLGMGARSLGNAA